VEGLKALERKDIPAAKASVLAGETAWKASADKPVRAEVMCAFAASLLAEAERDRPRQIAALERLAGGIARGGGRPDELLGVLVRLSEVSRSAGRFDKAVAAARKAVPLAVQLKGAGSVTHVVRLMMVGILEAERGDPGATIEVMEPTVGLARKLNPPEPVYVGNALSTLAIAYRKLGRYAEALDGYEEAEGVFGSLGDKARFNLGVTYDNHSNVLDDLGRHEEAVALRRKALALIVASHGAEHVDAVQTRANLATSLGLQGKHAEARVLLEDALAAGRKHFDADHPFNLVIADNLAATRHATGDYEGARALRETLVAGFRKAFGGASMETATAENNLAVTLGVLGRHKDALARYQAAEQVLRSPGLGRSMLLGWVRDGESKAHEALGDQQAALTAARAALEVVRAERTRRFAVADERRKLEAAEAASVFANRLLNLLVVQGKGLAEPARAKEAFELMLAEKGRVLRATMEEREALSALDDPAVKHLGDTWKSLTRQLAKLHVQREAGGGTTARAELDTRFDEALGKRGAIETQIARKSAIFAANRASALPTLDAVCKALPPKAALYEVVTIAPLRKEVHDYVGFLLEKEGCRLTASRLTGPGYSGQTLESEVRTAWEALADDGKGRPTPELTAHLYGPLLARLHAVETVLVAPDAALSLLPAEALPVLRGDKASFLGLEKSFRYLTSGTDLLRPRPLGGLTRGALVVGGATYAMHDTATAGQKRGKRGGDRGPLGTCSAFRGRWEDLEGAAAEGVEVGKLVVPLARGNVATLAGAASTEAAVRKAATGKRIVHIATHGFFQSAECSRAHDTSRAASGKLSATRANPLLYSGLVLAGAVSGGDGEDDGFLTADEVAAIDLRGTELVVLSACETGLGDLRSGEGVFGLRRAFLAAGARALVMSLWKVDDEATRLLMTSFYTALGAGRSPADAMALARRATYDALKKPGAPPPDPALWAAFIVVEP